MTHKDWISIHDVDKEASYLININFVSAISIPCVCVDSVWYNLDDESIDELLTKLDLDDYL